MQIIQKHLAMTMSTSRLVLIVIVDEMKMEKRYEKM
jgi:hypothetical protein